MFNRVAFHAAAVGAGLTLEKLACELGINPATLSRKMSGKSEFSRVEMANAQRILRLSDADFLNIFFADELTKM